MTPQSTFMVVAPLDPAREGDLRALLASMNTRPGVADPENAVVPFGRYDRLHFARFVILDDRTTRDITAYGVPAPEYPRYLAFLGDCDGPAREVLAELAEGAGDGLGRIFSHCHGYSRGAELLRWMRAREHAPAAAYTNWVGRTVRQIREEAALRDALESYLERAPELGAMEPREVRRALRRFVDQERAAGRLTLSPPDPTPLAWQLENALRAVGLPLLVLAFGPLLLAYLPLFVLQLRRREERDPVIAPRVDPEHLRKLSDQEDHEVTNQFSAMGSLKPGLFRRWTVTALLGFLDYTTRHIYTRGRLARVSTIHFARWVFLDGKRRVLFASSYDGSLESYMDDFINKVAFGLNLVFSNGVGYPSSDLLIFRGAKDEQKFKYFIRRHELATEVWYNSHPGLTASDLEKNTRIREGLERPSMQDAEIREWMQLL